MVSPKLALSLFLVLPVLARDKPSRLVYVERNIDVSLSLSDHRRYTPNGIKAGISAGDAYDYFRDHIGWWYDWSPNPSGHEGSPMAVPMLWGGGGADNTDWERLTAFRALEGSPTFLIGFEEPDCVAGSGSAGMGVEQAANLWNELMVPHGNSGTLLTSPSMCHQADETWLEPFAALISRPWDITNIHVNKNSAEGIRADIEYYATKYNRPIWVTEFACVDDMNGFVPCTDQGQIDHFIRTAVEIFESDDRVKGYAYSNGYGLGEVWPLMRDGQLSNSGQTYLDAISAYH